MPTERANISSNFRLFLQAWELNHRFKSCNTDQIETWVWSQIFRKLDNGFATEQTTASEASAELGIFILYALMMNFLAREIRLEMSVPMIVLGNRLISGRLTTCKMDLQVPWGQSEKLSKHATGLERPLRNSAVIERISFDANMQWRIEQGQVFTSYLWTVPWFANCLNCCWNRTNLCNMDHCCLLKLLCFPLLIPIDLK